MGIVGICLNLKEMSIVKKPSVTYNQRKELKMAKTKNRIRKMTFQKQHRNINFEPLSENDKYIIKTAGYKREGRTLNEILPRTTRRAARPQHI